MQGAAPVGSRLLESAPPQPAGSRSRRLLADGARAASCLDRRDSRSRPRQARRNGRRRDPKPAGCRRRDSNKTDPTGAAPLHAALAGKNDEILTAILATGPDMDVWTQQGMTALVAAQRTATSP